MVDPVNGLLYDTNRIYGQIDELKLGDFHIHFNSYFQALWLLHLTILVRQN